MTQKKNENVYRVVKMYYCRSKSTERVYLTCDLNIVKLWRMYNNDVDDDCKVKQSYFRNYFCKNYNIGFGSPQSDVCSTCLQFKEKTKTVTEKSIKQKLILDNELCKARAKSFYDLLREESPEVLVFAFDGNWLLCNAPKHVTQVEIIFPMVGHSYIRPDRVFGNIEKVVRKTSTMTNPDGYISIIKEHATVLKMGEDYKVRDWRTETHNVIRSPASWHFKFQPTETFILTKGTGGGILVRGEPFYRSDVGAGKGIGKKRKHLKLMMRKELQLGVSLKLEKIKSISSFLASPYGSDWKKDESLCYFTTLFHNNNNKHHSEAPADKEDADPIEDNV
ncbi:hypothetical protein QE152_g37274 [Popillia japonica]|uniref:Uncharacterized protein n=1 Tax=Popillia japonica TaxID=7064 RepID=A0AAW1IAQ6_POPJA